MTDIERAAELFRELAEENRPHKGDYFEGKVEAYTIAAEYLEKVAQGGDEC